MFKKVVGNEVTSQCTSDIHLNKAYDIIQLDGQFLHGLGVHIEGMVDLDAE